MSNVLEWFSRLFLRGETAPRRTVLVFSQDPLLEYLLDAALRPAGFEVHVATGVEEGIVSHWRCRDEVALVVLGGPMPGLSRRQLLAGIREADPSVPSCVWTDEEESPESDYTALGAVTMPRPATVADMRRCLLPLAGAARRIATVRQGVVQR